MSFEKEVKLHFQISLNHKQEIKTFSSSRDRLLLSQFNNKNKKQEFNEL